jgi:ANTAR domain
VRSNVVPEELDFEERLTALARDLVNEPDVQHTVQRVVDAAAANLDGVVSASVSLVRQSREIETPASSDDRALRADQLQYELEQGPCLDAIGEQGDLPDRRHDRGRARPPLVAGRGRADRCPQQPVVAAVHRRGAEQSGGAEPVLPGAAGLRRGEALAFTAQAAVALRSARTEEHLRSAMATRTLIGQAQGILMERLKMTPDRAFAVLSRLSQERNEKLRNVARQLVETGELPRWQQR